MLSDDVHGETYEVISTILWADWRIVCFFKERVYNTIIPRLVRLAEAPSHGKPILEYEPRNKGTIAYLNLAKEVIERNGTEKESPR